MRVSPAPPPTAGPNQPPPPHSPHMAPVIGGGGNAVPSHPSSASSESRPSNMHTPGYSPATPHMVTPPSPSHGYPPKMPHMPGNPPLQYAPAPYQQPQHQYPPRPQAPLMQPYSQGYPPGAQQGPSATHPSGHPYSRPPVSNHVPPGQPYGYHFTQQGWPQSQGSPGTPVLVPGQNMPTKGGANQPVTNCIPGPRSHTPPQFMKQHLQHKLGAYGSPNTSSAGPQLYPNGPNMNMSNNRESPQNHMPPPTSTPQPLTPSNTNAVESDHSGASAPLSNSNQPMIGPDGNPMLDEASQQSTVSNSSVASGEDRAPTPKMNRDLPGSQNLVGMSAPGTPLVGNQQSSHTSTPVNSAASPGGASMNSQQDDMENMSSPGWPKSPTSQNVYANSQPPPPPDNYRPAKSGDISRLYEMSDSPERRVWLDKLLGYMEEKGTAITACPTISKNPLDLYALYLHVRERGGFMEVTKNKQWKDVASVMGIGASSSGSYTLRRHYMKNLLPYECAFDRGGIDPQPIINKIESSSKKKSSKTLSVPSPGSSNSQDSFPHPGSNSSSMDGFSNGPHMSGPPPLPFSQYPPSSEYPGHMQNRQPPQPNSGFPGYQGNQYSGYQGMHGYSQGGFQGSNFQADRSYQQPGGSAHQNAYPNYSQPSGGFRPGPNFPSAQQGYQQEQYPGYQNTGLYPPQKPVNTASPGPPGPIPNNSFQGPRRHPDFEKSQPGWRGNNQFNSFSGPGPTTTHQGWSRPGEPVSTAGGPPPPPPPQWNQPRFPTQTSSMVSQGRWSGGTFSQCPTVRAQASPGTKTFFSGPPGMKGPAYPGHIGKLFPMDSVEAVLPVLVKRKRMGRSDVAPIDPWKLLMCLRCGLAAEVTWALDVLNVLLFDDQTVTYFGLQHMPGLLECLIEHLRRGLINMFDICSELELGMDDEATGANKRIKAEQHDYKDRLWYEQPPPSPSLDLDLGVLDECDPGDKEVILNNGTDFTNVTKTGKVVKIVKRSGALFMKEGNREWDKWEGFNSGVDTWSVGGGECTAHIISNMQSSVPLLPFTRLIQGKQHGNNSSDAALPEKVDDSEPKVPVEPCAEKVTETPEEKVVAEEPKAVVNCEQAKDILNIVNRTVDQADEAREKEKESEVGVFMPSIKPNRLNHAKASKLDAILKRIKKDPKVSKETTEASSDNPTPKDTSVKQEVVIKEEAAMPVVESKAIETELPKALEVEKFPIKEEDTIPEKAKKEGIEKLERRESSGSRRESGGFKRPYEDLEEESWNPDEASLTTNTEGQDWLAQRVICVGSIIRNLSFIPGNEEILSKSASLLALLGKTILLHHEHPKRAVSSTHFDKEEDADLGDWCSSLAPDTHWWWPYLHHIHENVLVTLANMSGFLDLSYYPEEISRPLLNGLLHWATCPSSYGQDPLPASGSVLSSALSPQRLALEALVKLCVLDQNTDLVLATPPFSRLDMLCSLLTKMICRGEDQVLREFAVNLLQYFSAADSGVARVIAMQNGCVSLLVSFIEEAEAAAMNVASSQGVCALKENPELMGTSLDMVRRSATALVYLSRVPDNVRILSCTENRLLTLVMSQILDTYVASQLAQVLFNMAQVQSEMTLPTSPVPPPPLLDDAPNDESLIKPDGGDAENSVECTPSSSPPDSTGGTMNGPTYVKNASFASKEASVSSAGLVNNIEQEVQSVKDHAASCVETPS